MLPCASIRAGPQAFNFSPIRCELAEPATLSAAEGSYSSFPAEVAELADAPDSKSGGAHAPCGFDSHLRHSVMEMRGPSPEAGFARREARSRLRRHKHKRRGLVGETWFPPRRDAPDSKSGGAQAPCGFDSHLRHSVMEMRGPSPKAGFARREARGRLRRHKHKTVESRHGRREAPAGLSTAARTRGRFDRAGRSPARCRPRATEWARWRSESQC
jgi:hypothetical protein